MSIITSEGRRDDQVRKIKDEYHAKEAENARRQKNELKKLTEKYEGEVEALSNEQSAKLQELQGYMKSRMSEQEQTHQNQIQGMREMYTQQQKKKFEESQLDLESQKHTYESELNQERHIHDSQRERLQAQFANDMKANEEAYKNLATSTREEIDKSVTRQKDKWNKNFDTHLEQDRIEHHEQIADINRRLTELRKLKESEIDTLKQQSEFEKSRLMISARQNKENQERANAAVHESMAKEFQSELKLNKAQYHDDLYRKVDALDRERQEFLNETRETVNRQLFGLKSGIKNEENERVIQIATLKRQEDLEKKHLMQDYEKRLADERQQKEASLKAANTQLDAEIDAAYNERTAMIKDLSESNLREKADAHREVDVRLAQIRKDMTIQNEQTTTQADAKVGRVNDLARQNIVRMQKYYDDNLGLMKKEYQKELNEERNRHIEERAELEDRYDKKLRDMEKSTAIDKDQKVGVLQERLVAQKDRFDDEIRRLEDTYREKLQSRERGHKDEIKSVELKYQGQIQQTKDSYEQDIEVLDKRHREEMNQLAQKMAERQKRS